uniref:Uncharacterized protein n=1 Tax=Arundo donax TaxID=35708 RepID=A0A0A8YTN4_ARUDO
MNEHHALFTFKRCWASKPNKSILTKGHDLRSMTVSQVFITFQVH